LAFQRNSFFPFWDILKHFFHISFFWHSFHMSQSLQSSFSNFRDNPIYQYNDRLTPSLPSINMKFRDNVWFSTKIHQLLICAVPPYAIFFYWAYFIIAKTFSSLLLSAQRSETRITAFLVIVR
jgi:hypothetical protein